jgi:NSS family neurotransmitter:Na+ symporter
VSNKSPSGGDQWGSRLGVILAVAGSAVGLGNFLRFPGQGSHEWCGSVHAPLLSFPCSSSAFRSVGPNGRWDATAAGMDSIPRRASTASIWRHKLARYLGAFALLIPLVIYMYYVVIEAWCLGYAWELPHRQHDAGQ